MFDLLPSYLIPVFIFLARICDVSLGTIRIAMVSRELKFRAALLGFFEVLIWALVVTGLLQNLDNWVNYVAYAGGFASGTFVGMYIEGKMKVGTIVVRIITQDKHHELSDALKGAGFTITLIEGHGGFAPVTLLFTVLKRKRWHEVEKIINLHDPAAFYSYEDVKFASSHGEIDSLPGRSPVNRLLRLRKGM